MWIENKPAETQRELLKLWIKESPIPMLISSANGEILWSNSAFEEFIGYTHWELVKGPHGNGKTWFELSVNDESLIADKMMVEECVNGKTNQYSIKKQYIPKNERPVWVEITVIRFPEDLNTALDCFLVIVVPFKNGMLSALNLAMEKNAEIVKEIKKMRDETDAVFVQSLKEVKECITNKTELEIIASAGARLMNKYPKISSFCLVIVLIMILGTSLVDAVKTAKELIGM